MAILCVGVTSLFSEHDELPQVAFHIIGCNISAIHEIRTTQESVLLNLSQNHLQGPLFSLPHFAQSAVSIDFSLNLISMLHMQAFSSSLQLHFVYLQSNIISLMEKSAFMNLSKLIVLDLSNNLLQSFHNIFNNVSNLVFFNVNNNSFHNLDSEVFSGIQIQYLHSDNLVLFCLKPSETRSLWRGEYFPLCSTLLGSEPIFRVFVAVSFLIFSLNATSLFVMFFDKKKTQAPCPTLKLNMTPSHMVVGPILVSHIVFSVYLCIIWVAHSTHRKNYVVNQHLWLSSIACKLAFSLFFLSTVLVPCLHFHLVFGTCQVVVYPFSSRYKSLAYVSKSTVALIALCAGFTTVNIVLFDVFYEFKLGLCLLLQT